MKLIRILFLGTSVLLLNSCVFMMLGFGQSSIERWPIDSPEISNRNYSIEEQKSVFDDYAWTVPVMDCVDLEFSNNSSSHTVGDYSFTIIKDGSLLYVEHENGEKELLSMKTDNQVYATNAELEWYTTSESRWVTHHRIDVQTVAVQKTRQVPKTSFNADGTTSTYYATEFYTDFETRHVPVVEHKWETTTVRRARALDVDYFEFQTPTNQRIIIYKTYKNDAVHYLLQNASYVKTTETIMDNEQIEFIFIDTNANGVYTDSRDMVFFKTWNPFNINSLFHSVSGFIANQWMPVESFKQLYLLEFMHNDQKNKLTIFNENDSFIEDVLSGTLHISGFTDNEEGSITLNGKTYPLKDIWGNIKQEWNIEHGIYTGKITKKGKLPMKVSFTIDSETPEYVLEYQDQGNAADVTLTNIFANSFTVIINHGEDVYFNEKQFVVPEGSSHVQIETNGFIFEKTLETRAGQHITLDYEQEIKSM